MAKKVNVQKGKQGFQRTTPKAAAAPATDWKVGKRSMMDRVLGRNKEAPIHTGPPAAYRAMTWDEAGEIAERMRAVNEGRPIPQKDPGSGQSFGLEVEYDKNNKND